MSSTTEIPLASQDSGILFMPSVSLGTHQAKVHPVVLLSILDHFTRRNNDQQRVIGTLLGSVSEAGDVEIRNCFPVPHHEKEATVEVDMDFHRTMFELHQRVNPKEIIVGWYATGSALQYNSSLIHEFYGREIRATVNKELTHPIHLTVDTELKNDRLGVQAYTSANVGTVTAEGPQGFMFLPIPCEIKLAESERLGLDLVARAKEAPGHVASLLTDLDNLERSISRVKDMLETAQKYVDDVVKGNVPANNTIGRYLMETVASVPKVDKTQFEQLFNNNLQDLLMVVYLSNLTRTQLAVAERLQNILF